MLGRKDQRVCCNSNPAPTVRAGRSSWHVGVSTGRTQFSERSQCLNSPGLLYLSSSFSPSTIRSEEELLFRSVQSRNPAIPQSRIPAIPHSCNPTDPSPKLEGDLIVDSNRILRVLFSVDAELSNPNQSLVREKSTPETLVLLWVTS